METLTGSEPLLKIMPYGTWRKRCFLFRYALDQSSQLLLTLQIVLGCIITLHPCLSFAILTISNNYDRFELALIPLICLCIEALIFTTTTLIVFLSELTSNSIHIASWHREVILSLLKDIYISGMVLISLILCIIYIDTEEQALVFTSITTMTLPLIILLVTSLVKCFLLKTQRTLLWCSLCGLCLIEISVFILRVDYQYNISWAVIIAPLALIFVTLMMCAVFSCYRRYKARDTAGVVFSLLVIGGCCSGIAFMVFLERFLMFKIKAILAFKVSGWITILLLGIGYSRKCGSWLLGVTVGHLEVDFWHFKHPVKTAELLANRSKSV